jgi:hypothetical protein
MSEQSAQPFGPIIPGPAGDDATVLLILARYFPGPITNPDHAAYIAEYVRLRTEPAAEE